MDLHRHERVAVVMIRAWLEPGATNPFRARITARLDLESGTDDVAAAASVEEVTAHVDRWLRRFVTSQANGPPRPGPQNPTGPASSGPRPGQR